MNPRPLLLLPFVIATAALPSACKRNDDAHTPSTAHAHVDESLTSIWTETSDVRRLHRLARWVQEHTAAEVADAVHSAPPAYRDDFVWLLQLKLREQNPGADDETRGKQLNELLARGHEDSTSKDASGEPSLRQELLELARRTPSEAFDRLRSVRLHPNQRNNIAMAILRQVAENSPRDALALLESAPGDRRDGLIAIARAWVEKDPRAALAWVDGLPRSRYNEGLRKELLETWSRNDPAAVVEEISRLPVTTENRSLFTRIVGNWLRDSPDESAKWIQSTPNPDPLVIAAAVSSLSSSHPALVARLLDHPTVAHLRQSSGIELASTWAQTDPTAARAWLESLPFSAVTLKFMEAFAGSLARKDQAAALAFRDSLPKDADTAGISAAIARSFDTPQQTLQWLLAQPDSSDNRSAISQALARMEFARAEDMLGMLNQLPAGPRRLPLYRQTAQRWFNEDPASAARWVTSLREPEIVQAVVNASYQSWADHDPAGLAAYLGSAQDNPGFADIINRFVYRWAGTDPAAAADWIAKTPDLKVSDYRVRDLFGALARHTPDTVEARLSALPAGAIHTHALGGIIGEVVKTDPQRAAQLFSTHAARNERRTLISRLVGTWAASDPAAAVAWTATQPASSTRDHGVRQIIYTVAKTDPQRALSFATMASTPEARHNLVDTAIRAWHRQDSAAALAALSQADLPPDRREKLRDSLSRR